MNRRSLGLLVSAALVALSTAAISTPAQAAPEDCSDLGPMAHCVWENQDFTGTMKVVLDRGCYDAADVGLSAIGSAKLGFGVMSLTIYSGENCTGKLTGADGDGVVLDPPGKSFLLFYR